MKNQKIPNLALVQGYGRFADSRGDENIHSATDNQPAQSDSVQLQVRVLLRGIRLGEALTYSTDRIA